MRNTIIIGYSQQKSNLCKAGDNEWVHTKKIAERLSFLLKEDNLVDVKLLPDASGTTDKERLINSVAFCNSISSKTDYVIWVHTNATGTNEIGKGAECIYYPGNEKTKVLGIRILKELGKILKEREVYSNSSLHAIRGTIANSLIVEAGFHDNEDEALWIHNNLTNIAACIRNGIYNALDLKVPNEETEWKNTVKAELKVIREGLQKLVEHIKTLETTN